MRVFVGFGFLDDGDRFKGGGFGVVLFSCLLFSVVVWTFDVARLTKITDSGVLQENTECSFGLGLLGFLVVRRRTRWLSLSVSVRGEVTSADSEPASVDFFVVIPCLLPFFLGVLLLLSSYLRCLLFDDFLEAWV